MKLLLAAVVAATLAGCASQSTVMVNDQGQIQECSAHGAGWLGAPLALISHSNCVTVARERGFRPVEELETAKFDKGSSALK
jgi:ABC-type uncharacterized transport system permease subunit